MSAIKKILEDALAQKTCAKHPMAAVIETVNHQYVLGWNGAPAGIPHDECARKGLASGVGMELCPSVHAERRAISRAARQGVKTEYGTIYLNEWFPCVDCAKSIIEAGISKLVTPDEFYSKPTEHLLLPKLQKQSYCFEMAEKLLREANIELIIDPSIRPSKPL